MAVQLVPGLVPVGFALPARKELAFSPGFYAWRIQVQLSHHQERYLLEEGLR